VFAFQQLVSIATVDRLKHLGNGAACLGAQIVQGKKKGLDHRGR
jgi:hypothetical protein